MLLVSKDAFDHFLAGTLNPAFATDLDGIRGLLAHFPELTGMVTVAAQGMTSFFSGRHIMQAIVPSILAEAQA